MHLKIALLQLLPEGSLKGQLEKGKAACIKAKKMGADIALFPEMWSDGYALPQDREVLAALSVDAGSDFVRAFGKLADELQMAIGITFLEKQASRLLNSMILFDRHGAERLHYAKVHTCEFDEEKVLSPGDGFYTAELDIGRDVIRVGAMICFDREFPESARILMLQGAEVILAPNACPMEINRLSALRTRAYENMLAVATCNYPKGQPDCNGRSTIFDGVAWLEEEPGVRDMCILEAPEEEGVYLAEIDMDMLRSYRETEVMGNKYRHPDKYGILAAGEGARAAGSGSDRRLPFDEVRPAPHVPADCPVDDEKEKKRMICELNDPSKAAPVFAGWDDPDTGIIACLENVMGRIYADDPEHPRSALAVIGDFAFCAGEPDLELLRSKPDGWMLVVPQNEAWETLIEDHFPAGKRIRYALKKDTVFDRDRLEAMAKALPEGFSFRSIDGEVYDLCQGSEQFKDCVAAFGSKERFLALGRGIAVMKDGRIVSAASSYYRSRKKIDIEINTLREARHRGLGKAAAAKLILSCLDEGLHPTWDAANKLSVRLAEKLGYEFSGEYVCFAME